jgi:hypothetical protein
LEPKSDGNLLYTIIGYSSIKHCLIRGANTDRIFFCQAKTKAQVIIGLLPSISAKHGGKRTVRICAGGLIKCLKSHKKSHCRMCAAFGSALGKEKIKMKKEDVKN